MIQFISYSGLFISVCAVCYHLFYTHLLNETFVVHKSLLIFFSTLISYISVQLIPIYKTNVFHPRQIWFQKNKRILWFLVCLSFIVISICSFYLTLEEFLNYAHLFVIVLFYEKVLTRKNELRKIPYIKPFLISYVWACMATLNSSFAHESFYLLMTESFLFILALTIPFDIRDTEHDQKQNLITLVHLLGERSVKFLCLFFYLGSQVILFQYVEIEVTTVFSAIIMWSFYVFLLMKSQSNQHDYYFLYGIDSLIIFKLLLLL